MKIKQIILSTFFSSLLVVITLSLFGFSDNQIELNQATNELPIGTIVIWAGENPPNNDWEICIGQRKLKSTNSKLYEAIGGYWNKDVGQNEDFFQLPDLRGVFIRGVNGSRNDIYKDVGPRKSTTGILNLNNSVGSFQYYATALPTVTNFRIEIDESGKHGHTIEFGRSDKQAVSQIDRTRFIDLESANDGGSVRTNQSGSHTHSAIIIGGDSETRPNNAYVNYIIKVN